MKLQTGSQLSQTGRRAARGGTLILGGGFGGAYVARCFVRVLALPTLPQVADHLAYAWTVTAMLDRRGNGG
jgi:hypothetical protein